jgi:hypothetical protein
MKFKFGHFLAVLVSSTILVGCASESSTSARSREVNICSDFANIWKDLKANQNSSESDKIILSIKQLGSKWPESEDNDLKDILREISEYSLAENLKINFQEQSSYRMRDVVLLDLFYKAIATHNACEGLEGLLYSEYPLSITDEEISQVYLRITNGQTIGVLN